MPKKNTEQPPLARDPIATCSHTQASMSWEGTVQSSDAIPATPVNEQRNPRSRYTIVYSTLGPIIV